ncbi:MAG: FAD-dependent oxidoreductase [Candidatus Saccharibacteria bacterium]
MFKHLMAEGKIGNLILDNRIIMPAMATGLANTQGEITAELLAYYEARAKSGPGAIIVEVSCVDAPRGRVGPNQIRIDHARYTAGLSRLAEVIKSRGSRAFIQLHHAGRQTHPMATEGMTPLAPSAIPCRLMRVMPKEATIEEIKDVQQKYVGAAFLAQTAGFDGVELHAAHGYLLSQFISPYSNKRTDEYGGDTLARTRIVTEILHSIKQVCPGLVVGVRFNINDFVKGGIEPEEGLEVARLLEEAGADYLSVSCGIYESGHTSIEPASFSEGWRVALAQPVKAQAKVPVIVGGVIRHPEYADQMVERAQADFVFVGRNQIADEAWAAKVRKGKAEEIRPCLSCNTCIGRSFQALPIACAVNPRAGRENWLKPLPAASVPQTVIVVGGGPAGMAAALSLADRGHKVTLVEAQKELGGMLKAASKPPHKERIGYLKDYLIEALGKTKVDIRQGKELTADMISSVKPDAVIVAAGSRPKNLPGTPGNNWVQAVDILCGKHAMANKRVLVVGGGLTGCETALFLASEGNDITLIEATGQLAVGIENTNRLSLLANLKAGGIKILKNTALMDADPNTARVKGLDGELEVDFDFLVLALGFDSVTSDLSWIKEIVPRVIVIGDARAPRNIESAMYEAELAAREIE